MTSKIICVILQKKGDDVKNMTNNDIRKRYTFRIPEELYQMAKAKADRLGISMNALLLDILWEWKKKEHIKEKL